MHGYSQVDSKQIADLLSKSSYRDVLVIPNGRQDIDPYPSKRPAYSVAEVFSEISIQFRALHALLLYIIIELYLRFNFSRNLSQKGQISLFTVIFRDKSNTRHTHNRVALSFIYTVSNPSIPLPTTTPPRPHHTHILCIQLIRIFIFTSNWIQ